MEHIRQFDWCFSQPDIYFLKEEDLANSVTEKILRNKFHDPLISSDSEDETPSINWDEVFKKKQILNRQFRTYVPCLPNIQYPKLSALNAQQHYQILRVICAQNPDVFEQVFIPKPTKTDQRAFEELRTIYEQEQKEYMEWARTLWTSGHCVRALRPKPAVETVYEAEFNMRAKEMEAYPKTFHMAAQIPLEARNCTFDMVLDKELVNVDIKALPQIECRPITKKLTIVRPCTLPEPCNKHPCKFILPLERSVTILPLTEVHRELAQFALDNGCQYVCSEGALRCLLELHRAWDLPVTVSSAYAPDGETENIVVLGNEFSVNREPALTRTYRAYRHLLQHTLLPPTEKYKLHYKDSESNKQTDETNVFTETMDLSSDEEDNGLCIDENLHSTTERTEPQDDETDPEPQTDRKKETSRKDKKETTNDGEFYSCTCKDTIFERPPPRSFKRWQIRDATSAETFNVVIHTAHKVRDESGEVILEPIPEYQLDLGGSEQPRGRIRSLMMSLYLRKNAALINVRVDGATGEVATFERTDLAGMTSRLGDVTRELGGALQPALAQLRGLLPGHYVLRHEPSHGNNALLFAAKASSEASLKLHFDCSQAEDEASQLKTPPVLSPVLLPYHKHRRVAPCAFTPHAQHVARAPPARAPRPPRPPPRALPWPKRKNKRKRKNS